MIAKLLHFRWLPLLALGALLLGSCDRDDVAARSGWEFEQERMAITQKLALAEYRFSQAPVDFTGRLSELQQDLASLSRQTAELKQRRSRLLAEIRDLEDRNLGAALQAQQVRRENAVGTRYPTLKLSSGKVYHNAVIDSINDAGVTIHHQDGLSRLDYFKLTPGQRLEFGLDEVSATAALLREDQAALAYERWIDAGMVLVRQQQRETAEAAKREEEAARERGLIAAAYASQLRMNALSSTASSRSLWQGSTYSRPRRSVYYYPYSYHSCLPQYRVSRAWTASAPVRQAVTRPNPIPRPPGAVTPAPRPIRR